MLNSQAALRGASFLLGGYLRAALATTRWTLDGEAHLAPFVPGGKVIAAFWHECLPLMPALWLRLRRRNSARTCRVLVSRHRDGRFIGDIMRGFGIGVVHGSSSVASGKSTRDRGGPASVRALLAALAAGEAVVMTPDGPRGPPRRAAAGVAQLAAASGAPVLPAAARMRLGITLKSWDRMRLPLPFGQGVLVCLEPIFVSAEDATDGLGRIEAALNAAALRAERLLAEPAARRADADPTGQERPLWPR